VKDSAPSFDGTDGKLAHYAKLVVAATFLLIFVGGHTTTRGAGMAFPDWPLSHGSLNPAGWLEDVMQRLEHGHRLLAQAVGLLIGILCAWIWQSKWSVPAALLGSILLAVAAKLAGTPRETVAHVGLWSSAAIFAVALLYFSPKGGYKRSAAVRWLAFAAFIGVLAQAIMGGLRVTIESGGDVAAATTLRVMHGCFAQLELCLLVALAVMLSPVWGKLVPQPQWRPISRLAWILAGSLFLQLVAGATMRHLGAGLAIPTFPEANTTGGWWPAMQSGIVHLHFAHSRVGPMLITCLVVALLAVGWRRTKGEIRLQRPLLLLALLVVAQITMGMFVVWQMRPPLLTTLHVVNGAALLATTVLLAMRAGRALNGKKAKTVVDARIPQEVAA
jgi:cytochrome c oxidase assembly protein subunit 15